MFKSWSIHVLFTMTAWEMHVQTFMISPCLKWYTEKYTILRGWHEQAWAGIKSWSSHGYFMPGQGRGHAHF